MVVHASHRNMARAFFNVASMAQCSETNVVHSSSKLAPSAANCRPSVTAAMTIRHDMATDVSSVSSP